jgi:hypothetical protein
LPDQRPRPAIGAKPFDLIGQISNDGWIERHQAPSLTRATPAAGTRQGQPEAQRPRSSDCG